MQQPWQEAIIPLKRSENPGACYDLLCGLQFSQFRSFFRNVQTLLPVDDRECFKQAAPGFEPGNNGFANRRLRPLGYAAKSLSRNDLAIPNNIFQSL